MNTAYRRLQEAVGLKQSTIQKLDKSLEKTPWDFVEGMTEEKYHTFLRKVVRDTFKNHPVKVAFKEFIRKPAPVGHWYDHTIDCSQCGNTYPEEEINIDHKYSMFGFDNLEEFIPWMFNIINVEWEDLEPICHECHHIRVVAKRDGISTGEAALIKRVAEFRKDRAAHQKLFLQKLGFSGEDLKNKKRRCEVYKEWLKPRYIKEGDEDDK